MKPWHLRMNHNGGSNVMKKMMTVLTASLFLAACQSLEASEMAESDASSPAATAQSDGLTGSAEEKNSPVAEEVEEAAAYAYEINPAIFTVEPIADADAEVVLLTFDDAPQPPDSHTLEIARTVQAKDANAIFFVMGQFLEDEEAKDIIKEVYDMGFEIGNHSYSHPDLSALTYAEQLEEVTLTNDLIEEITGERPRFIRAPYGSYNGDTEAIAAAENMTMMNWTYGYDWVDGYMEEAALADIMVNAPELGNGGNLLMHDRPWTSAAIGTIIDGLRSQGYEMVDPTLIASPGEE